MAKVSVFKLEDLIDGGGLGSKLGYPCIALLGHLLHRAFETDLNSFDVRLNRL
jgi:hypothetical protein